MNYDPNWIVPTAPPGTTDNRAASTAFVAAAITGGLVVGSLSAMSALPGGPGTAAVLADPLKGGVFTWVSPIPVNSLGVPATTGDPGQGIYVPSSPGACWVRQFDGYVRPEWWGAIGAGYPTDDTTAINNMCAYGAWFGSLAFQLMTGKTYTTINNVPFQAIPYLIWEGNDAAWCNIRPGDGGGNIVGGLAGYDALSQIGGNPFSNFIIQSGPLVGNAVNNQGHRILSAAANTYTFTTLDGANPPLGRVLLFGSDKQGSDSFPPCARNYEYNEIVYASGGQATLRNPLMFDYDQNWPETAFTTTAQFTASIDINGIMTVTAVASGTITAFARLAGNNIPFFMAIAPFGTSGTTGTGATGTYQMYDNSTWQFATLANPVLSGTVYCTNNNTYGAARYIYLDFNAAYNPNPFGRAAIIRNVRFIDNPIYPANTTLTQANGRLGIGFSERIYCYKIRASVTYMSMTNWTEIDGLTGDEQVTQGGVTPSNEIDKLIGKLTIKNSTLQPNNGTSVRDLELIDCKMPYGMQFLGLNTLRVLRCIIGGRSVGNSSTIWGGVPARQSTLEDCQLVPINVGAQNIVAATNTAFVISVAANAQAVFTITNGTYANGQVTFTTSVAHGVVPGQTFIVYNAPQAFYNGTYIALAGTTGSTLIAAAAQSWFPLSAASWAAGNLTLNTPIPHGLASGNTFFVYGATNAAYNGFYTAGAGTQQNKIVAPLVGNPGAAVAPFGTVQVGTSTTIASGNVTVPGSIVTSRSNFQTPRVCQYIYQGAILCDNIGMPKFRVTRLPYAVGDNVTGNIQIEGDFLQPFGALPQTIYVPQQTAATIKNCIAMGPYGRNLTAAFGTAAGQFTAPNYPIMKVRDKWITDNTITVDSEMLYPVRASGAPQASMYFGAPFIVSKIIVDVLQAGTSGSLQLRFRDVTTGAYVLLVGTGGAAGNISLATVGRREISIAGYVFLGADTVPSPLPPAPLPLVNPAVEINFLDTSFTTAQPANWVVVMEGTWVRPYGALV